MTIIVEENSEQLDPSPESAVGEESQQKKEDTRTLDDFVVTLDDEDDGGEEDLSKRDPSSLTAYERKILHWQESPFAVGRVNVAWKDDRSNWFRPGSAGNVDTDPKVCCSAYVCGCLGARRVGNLAVLLQRMEEYDHIEVINEDTGEQRKTRRKRPRLLWVIGPYWPVNFCLTYPLIVGISLLTGIRNIGDAPIWVVVVWSSCTFLMIFSLIMAGCRDPGVLYRHAHKPPDGDDWRWNDQAKTFRPPKARFDPECQTVVEGFDHTCPWVGTAIGAKNMFWFRIFVTMVPVCIVISVVINIFGL